MRSRMVVNSSVFTSTGAEVCEVGITWVDITDVVALAGMPCSVNREGTDRQGSDQVASAVDAAI